MDFKVNMKYLSKDDLIYELALRGATPKPTESEMRSYLRHLKRLASASSSFIKPDHPYTFEQDATAIGEKFSDIETRIKDFVGTRTSASYKKITTALAFVNRRVDNAQPTSEAEKKQCSGFVLRIAELSAQLKLKIKSLERASSQSILNSTMVAMQGLTSSNDSSDDEEDTGGATTTPVPNANASHNPNVASTSNVAQPKAVPVSAWGLKFSGLRKDISVSAFLERAEELKISRNSSDSLLFNSAVDIFEGPALIWYRANRDAYSCWSELAAALRKEFQAIDYDERLFEEIKHRTQGAHESIGLYVSVMKNLFSRLSWEIPETAKLRILQRNILPFYQTQLGLTEVHSIDELLTYGKILEARKASVEAYVPPPMRGKSLEPDLAYVGSETASYSSRAAVVSTSTSKPPHEVQCWNCQQLGHRYPRCTLPLKRFCFRCGKPNVTVATCTQCSGNGRRAR